MLSHLAIPIKGLEANLEDLPVSEAEEYSMEVFGMSLKELRNRILQLKKKGFKYVPSARCEHNPDGSCPGHKSISEQYLPEHKMHVGEYDGRRYDCDDIVPIDWLIAGGMAIVLAGFAIKLFG